MKFKLDENLPDELALDLRALGFDTDTVADESLGGAPDEQVVSTASAAQRILLTLDKGIANVLRYPTRKHAGVVLFRPDSSGRKAVLTFIRERLSSVLELNLANQLTVVGPSRIRFR